MKVKGKNIIENFEINLKMIFSGKETVRKSQASNV